MKKIMFDDDYGLTDAVLEGRKTMTRRIIKAPKTMEGQWVSGFALCKRPGSDEIVEVMALDADEGMINNILPKYKPGEVVAVAQSYQDAKYPSSYIIDEFHPNIEFEAAGWTNKMFVRADLMPHQIRITNVCIERLQDISDEDCLREGVLSSDKYAMPYGIPLNDGAFFWYHTPREAFAALIDKVSGKGTWESNPWVFVYEFKLVK